MSSTIVTKTWESQANLFELTYQFDYATTPVSISVTISAPGDQSPPGKALSPPVTPQSFKFPKTGQLKCSVQSPAGDPFDGEMKVVPFSDPNSNQNAGMFCDFHYGPESLYHFEGINITFQTSM